jgi:pimeloyl-ACP methyl ester carboxylesterase
VYTLRLLAAILAVTFATGCAKLPPNFEPDEAVTYRTSDGWEIGLRHYPGDGETVLLVHGMAANHYNWDYRREVSLAAVLQDQGWDVWVPDMRGDPNSVPPNKKAKRTFSFDDYASKDLPAAVDAVLELTDKDALYWVGHSMGGILLYTALSTFPEKILAGVAISSPARLTVQRPIHRAARRTSWMLVGNGVLPSRFLAVSAMWMGRSNPMLGLVTHEDNVDMRMIRGMARTTVVDLPFAIGRQVREWLIAEEIVSLEGEPWVTSTDTPLLVMAGGADRIVPPENVFAACDIFPNCESVLLDPEAGFSISYGHIDPVLSPAAPKEVYPLVTGFLDTQRAALAHKQHTALRQSVEPARLPRSEDQSSLATTGDETSQSEAKPTQSSPAR